MAQGRPSVPLAIRPDAACLGGVSLREDGTILLLADLYGTVLRETRSTSPGSAVSASPGPAGMTRRSPP